MAKSKVFKATVRSWGNSCGIELPFNPRDVFGRVRAPVRATVRGHTFRTTTCAMHGGYWIPFNRANRGAAGVGEGDSVSVRLALDEEARTVEAPEDLVRALGRVKGAKAGWARLSYTHRREWVESIEGAKRAETRARRIGRAVEAVAGA